MPVVYGKHPVEEILEVARDRVKRVVIDRADRIAGLSVTGLTVVEDRDLLDRLCDGGNHQGIAAELANFQYAQLSDVLDIESGCLLILDQVQDPHNLGAILRSAAALGVRAVVIGKDRAASVTDTVIRTSAGFAYRIDVVQVTNIARTLEQLAEDGFWSVGMAASGESAIWEVDLGQKIAIVVGGEGPGIRRLVLDKCDFKARIPMASGVESLNVSVAAGMALYEWHRQRSAR